MRPPKADPLLFPCEVSAYRISVNPCGPALSGPARPSATETAMPAATRTAMGMIRAPMPASLTSRAWIFLPRYSGVRPIIRPPMKTAMMA